MDESVASCSSQPAISAVKIEENELSDEEEATFPTQPKRQKMVYPKFSFSEKLAAIEMAETYGNKVVGERFGVSATAIARWRRQELKIRFWVSSTGADLDSVCRMRSPFSGRKPHPILEQRMLDFVKERDKSQITIAVLCQAGRTIWDDLLANGEGDPNMEFMASPKWARKFCRRNGFKLKFNPCKYSCATRIKAIDLAKIHGTEMAAEQVGASRHSVRDWLKSEDRIRTEAVECPDSGSDVEEPNVPYVTPPSYDLATKLAVVEEAKISGQRAAARKYGTGTTSVKKWIKQEPALREKLAAQTTKESTEEDPVLHCFNKTQQNSSVSSSENLTKSGKRKRKRTNSRKEYSCARKLEAVEAAKTHGYRKAARMFEVAESSLRDWTKAEVRIRCSLESESNGENC